MRIDPKSFPSPFSGAGAPKRAGASRFALEAQAGSPRAGVAATAGLATVGALLALQGEDDATEKRRRSIKRGHDLLDGLDRLKAALLSGRVSAGELGAIAARLSERREATADPRLDDLLAHIELRAEVELAKLRRR